MVYESEIIKQGDLKVGNVYRIELLNFYACDYNCMLIIPDSPASIPITNRTSNYRVSNIINNCSVFTDGRGSILQTHYDSIIILHKV